MKATDWLCLWYLRLNGYFTMPNFIVHGQPGSRTDIDILGVRFPYSRESDFYDDIDHLRFPDNKVDIVFAEATTRRCKINGPWRRPGVTLEYVLRRVGFFSCDGVDVDTVANRLYQERKYANKDVQVRVVCFGGAWNGELQGATQILWKDVIDFIRKRFQDHKDVKADHQHWDNFGQFLWDQLSGTTVPEFDSLVEAWGRQQSS